MIIQKENEAEMMRECRWHGRWSWKRNDDFDDPKTTTQKKPNRRYVKVINRKGILGSTKQRGCLQNTTRTRRRIQVREQILCSTWGVKKKKPEKCGAPFTSDKWDTRKEKERKRETRHKYRSSVTVDWRGLIRKELLEKKQNSHRDMIGYVSTSIALELPFLKNSLSRLIRFESVLPDGLGACELPDWQFDSLWDEWLWTSESP